jgi:hypothetical protein
MAIFNASLKKPFERCRNISIISSVGSLRTDTAFATFVGLVSAGSVMSWQRGFSLVVWVRRASKGARFSFTRELPISPVFPSLPEKPLGLTTAPR